MQFDVHVPKLQEKTALSLEFVALIGKGRLLKAVCRY